MKQTKKTKTYRNRYKVKRTKKFIRILAKRTCAIDLLISLYDIDNIDFSSSKKLYLYG